MTLDKQKLIDAMQEAANIHGYENEYCTGEMMEFALAALQDNMPDPFIVADEEARILFSRCCQENPEASVLPSIEHFQQQTRLKVDFHGLWMQLKNLGR